MRSGVLSSQHPNCHHQIVFAKFNLKIFNSLPCIRLVWCYQQANTDLIKRAIELFDWKKVFLILTLINSFLFSTKQSWTSLRIFLWLETINWDDRDPPWMNKQIKPLNCVKSALHRRLKWRMLDSKLLDKLDAFQAKLQSSINLKKPDPSTSPKCYWTQIKTLLNGRKIPCISSLFYDNKFITGFKSLTLSLCKIVFIDW